MENDFTNISVVFDEQDLLLKLIGCPPQLLFQCAQMALEFWDAQRKKNMCIQKKDEIKKEFEELKTSCQNSKLQHEAENQSLQIKLQNLQTIQSLQTDTHEKERQCDKYRMFLYI
ncbi:hypothetical protein RFI_10142 [Reticulomyxa filosa]|uniref:Uncharacterized protein n=1 Tax=Reticulomyxa filosa TaxID=46433 RepID=X6NL30_RETFI|nr:hypothetical protein RFI_10142 [Reticulomyxa filosa]|eukprot:ETO26990.1 hypothetical protein RFI_10142 [Reticulomyxa filosa]